MKKVLTLLLVGVLAIGTVGCGSKDDGELFSTAAVREWSEDDQFNVIMDEEAIALAQSVASANASGDANLKAAATAALDKVNEQRAAAGLSALTWSNGLESAAMVRAQEIVTTWSHTRPNGSDWWTVNSNLMYGENLAKGYSSADAAVAGWMASPTHKANIMDGSFKTCGIAIFETGGQWYWAQEFGY